MPRRDYRVDHRLSDADENIHSVWDNGIEPRLAVEPGSVVRFECRETTDRQVSVETTAADVPDVSSDPIHPLTGPVAIEGAEPGDVLAVELLDLQHKGWGYTMVMPGEAGLGLLPEEFSDPAFHAWDLEGGVGHFRHGIEVPLAPFPGTIGVAPGADGEHDTTPPRATGGNMDVKHLTAGSTLYLPVEVAGALFSVGDCHAAQGDGEVCVTGIEAPMFVTARLGLRPEMDLDAPRFETGGPFTATGVDEPMYATAGIDSDLMEATRQAVRAMVDHLHRERGLTRPEAYMLCSAAVDLKLNQVVDAPNWTVSAYLPESVFPG